MTRMEPALLKAVECNNETEVLRLLQAHPDLDVNWTDSKGCSSLCLACARGFPSIVSTLTAHPGINVNQETRPHLTPFYLSCYNGRTEVVRLLLRDPRVDVNLAGKSAGDARTALWWASYHGHLDIVRWWIASGRDLELGEPGDSLTDVLGAARDMRNVEVVGLLERYVEDPEETRFRVKLELGDREDLAAEVFALVVFLCDDFLRIKQPGLRLPSPSISVFSSAAASAALTTGEEARHRRFYSIASRLPMELQMLLCQRVFGSTRNHITCREVERALKPVTRRLEEGELQVALRRRMKLRVERSWWLAWFSFFVT